MATAMVKSGPRTALRSWLRGTNASKRTFATSARHDDAYEGEKWEKITYAGIATCTVYTIYNMYKGHLTHPRYYEEPPKPYPYLRIHNKDFPWGPDPLIEHVKKKKKEKKKVKKHC